MAEKQYLESAHKLYKLLLKEPLQHYSENKFNQLTIVPDGILNTIPFTALLHKESDSWTNPKNMLVTKYAISYNYFCKMLLSKKENTINYENNFTSFGLEFDDYTLNYLKKIAKDSIENNIINEGLRNNVFTKLTFSDDKAIKLAELMEGDSWINKEATKTNFIKNAVNTNIVHLATHSLSDAKNPNLSALIFTKENDSLENFLRLDEIYNHKFHSDMITLSACNTGFGKYQKGEGLHSLARAFNFSSIPGVTATLWNIPDASSEKIMKLYYTYLKQGNNKAIDLQKAHLEYLQNDAISSLALRLPVFWSAWVIIGNNDIVHFQKQGSNLFLYLIVFAFIILLLFYLKKVR